MLGSALGPVTVRERESYVLSPTIPRTCDRARGRGGTIGGMASPSDYGRYFWNVNLKDGSVVALHADEARVTACGALEFIGHHIKDSGAFAMYALAPGVWLKFHAASVLDGGPVCVESIT